MGVDGRFFSGITYLLHRLGFSYKKPSVVPGKADSVRQEQFLRAYRRLRKLLYLPPYAPNLNLIERLWKFFKKHVLYNQYYETLTEFRVACLKFFKKKNIRKYRQQFDTLLTDNFEIIYV
jgi:hypothetical protein